MRDYITMYNIIYMKRDNLDNIDINEYNSIQKSSNYKEILNDIDAISHPPVYGELGLLKKMVLLKGIMQTYSLKN